MTLPVWEDRRGLFQKGRELHDPSVPKGRRASESSITDVLTKTITGSSAGAAGGDASPASPSAAQTPFSKATTTSTASPASPGAGLGQRRRSSTASSTGMFGNLTSMKRGSEGYSDRRGSIDEMSAKSGMFSGLWNSTFRGSAPKPKDPNVEPKRGVME